MVESDLDVTPAHKVPRRTTASITAPTPPRREFLTLARKRRRPDGGRFANVPYIHNVEYSYSSRPLLQHEAMSSLFQNHLAVRNTCQALFQVPSLHYPYYVHVLRIG